MLQLNKKFKCTVLRVFFVRDGNVSDVEVSVGVFAIDLARRFAFFRVFRVGAEKKINPVWRYSLCGDFALFRIVFLVRFFFYI